MTPQAPRVFVSRWLKQSAQLTLADSKQTMVMRDAVISCAAGTGMYSSGSMPWLLTQYASRGLAFDEIWGERQRLTTLILRFECLLHAAIAINMQTGASLPVAGWELKQLNSTSYWDAWPDKDKAKMHFYNEGYDIRTDSPNFPLNILKRIHRPGDFVAIK